MFRRLILYAAIPFLQCILMVADARDASASIVIQIQRVSDTEGILTGTGSMPSTSVSNNRYILSLGDPYGTPPAPTDNHNVLVSSTLMMDTAALDFAFTAGFGDAFPELPALYLGNNSHTDLVGKSFSGGELHIRLSDSTFDSIGSTGNVYWGGYSAAQLVGTWEIVAAEAPVPEPTTLAIWGAFGGMGLIGAWRRRKRGA